MSKHQKSKKVKRETLQQDVEERLETLAEPEPELPPDPRNYKDANWNEVG
jgi:hypothetical protein